MKRLLTIYLLLLLGSLFCTKAAEQEPTDSVFVRFIEVYDGFTEQLLDKVRVSVLEADSVTVLADSLEGGWTTRISTSSFNYGEEVKDYIPYNGRVPRRDVYVIQASRPGFAPQQQRVVVGKDETGKPAPTCTAEPFYLWPARSKELGTAVVEGSKVVMIMKDDTLIYNASAFQLAEGSMLDGLIEALPGVKLDDDGRITVNGKFVSSLLVNGREFFEGKPEVALKNLPAYTVNKVKVYRKPRLEFENIPNRSEADKENDPLVMDVTLKREYAQGWLANVEAGGGSRLGGGFDPVWMGRLFAMRYTTRSSVGVFANINNMNDQLHPNRNENWGYNINNQGTEVRKTAGIDFSIDGKEKRALFQTSMDVSHLTSDTETRTLSETYLPLERSYFSRGNSIGERTSTDVNWSARLTLPKLTTLRIEPSLFYSRSKDNSNSYYTRWEDRTSGTGPAAAYQSGKDVTQMLYERLMQTNTEMENKSGSLRASNFVVINRFESPQYFSASASARYNHRDYNSLTNDRLTYTDPTQQGLNEQRASSLPATSYAYDISAYYSEIPSGIGEATFHVRYEYSQEFNSGRRNQRERDLAQNKEEGNSDGPLVPSANDAGEWLVDERNSYHTTRMERAHKVNISLSNIKFGRWSANADVALTLTKRGLHDMRSGDDQNIDRNNFTAEPSGGLSYKGKKANFSLRYTMQESLPDLLKLLDVRDDSQPLYVSLGNSHLRKATTHALSFNLGHSGQGSRNSSVDLTADYRKTNHAVGTARTYDQTTGTTTTRPENIDGNWEASLGLNYMQMLDEKNRWTLETSGKAQMRHSVDFSSLASDDGAPTRMAVDNLKLDADAEIHYRFKKWHAALTTAMNHTRQRGDEGIFTSQHFTNFMCGVALTAPLPGGIDLETDMTLYLRRGYSDASMNTSEWVWNLSASKAFGKKKNWLLRLRSFDLLQQLKQTYRTVNAQGTYETWYNTVTAYVSLHLTYRFDMKPKKKQGNS